MKKIILYTLLFVVMTSCDDKLNITPKGQTLLNTVTDLETLLNQEYDLQTPIGDLSVICNEAYSYAKDVNLVITQTNTLGYTYIAYDETVNRQQLTTFNDRYETIYKYINYMNVILSQLKDAEGEEYKKVAIGAEARVMRAYLHWLIVNIYAQQYDDGATATKQGGIAYVTDLNVNEQKSKLSLAEVYQNILDDCAEEYIEKLPEKAPNVIRAGKAWGYAVRAKVLMQMKKYAEALPYALKSIKYHDKIQDRSVIMSTVDWKLPKNNSSNLLYMGNIMSPYCEVMSIETTTLFEPGDYVRYHGYRFGTKLPGYELWNAAKGSTTGGIDGALMFYGFSTNINEFGITTERMYYTAAECYIRTNQINEGLELVNTVRKQRIHPDQYKDFEASTEEEAMALLQKAKWIECLATYENFFDCKRWNSEDKYKRTITRKLPMGTYSIAPGSPLWVFPFPDNVVSHNPSLTPNY